MKRLHPRPLRLFCSHFLLTAGLLVFAFGPASAVTLDFQGLQNTERVGAYYSGGLGSLNSGPGPDYGITFAPAAGAQISTTISSGQSVFFVNNLDPVAEYEPITMNVTTGFAGQFSFQYATPSSPDSGSVIIYSGLNHTGTVLGTQSLPSQTGVPLYNASSNPPTVLSFPGTAHSVVFVARGGAFDIDNITFTPGQAPGLFSLTSDLPIYPAFRADVTTYSLKPILAPDVAELTIKAGPGSPLATMEVSVNGASAGVLAADTSTSLPLEPGENTITIAVTTPSAASVTYTLKAIRGQNVGPAGPAGPAGPPGPQGQPGVTNVSTASPVYTLKANGTFLVTDPLVTNDSVILLQFVGGGRNTGQLYAKSIVAGKFTAVGPPKKRFRYVILN